MVVHSIVIPVFNEEQTLSELYRRLKEELLDSIVKSGETFELILVDDGSSDRSFELMKLVQQNDPARISIVKFSRNFGHQMAITAGFDLARGETITSIDADLQDPPAAILQMIAKWKEGYDIVYGVREKRLDESVFKKITASFFYRLLRFSTKLDIPKDVGDFRLTSRPALEALKSLREQHRFVRGMAKWVGFRQTSVFYTREGRFAGETKYPLAKMLRLAWDGFTGFSLLPLRVASYIGFGCVSLSALAGLCVLLLHIGYGWMIEVWAPIVISIFFIGGVQLVCIGILGEYLGRVFEQVKGRPLYLIQEVIGPVRGTI